MGEGKVIPTKLPDIIRTAEFENSAVAQRLCMEDPPFIMSTTQKVGNPGLNLQ